MAFSLFPMLYVLIIGMILGIFKVFNTKIMETAAPYIGLSVMWLTCRTASTVGPNLHIVATSGASLIIQKLGQIMPAFLAIPVAVFIFKMGRQAVGASFSTSREDSIAIIGSIYSSDSQEGQGVMGAYITGTVIGTIFCAILSGIVIATGIFHPYALAMASGVGSASMMTASLGSLVEAYPYIANEIQAYTASSQILGSVMSMYMLLFISLPTANFLYKIFGGPARYTAAQVKRAKKSGISANAVTEAETKK